VKPEKKKSKKKKKDGPPVFVELEMFTANLKDDDADRFIQIRLVAEVRDAPAGEMLKTMMPAVRNEVLLLLGSKEAKDIATRGGKETLAGEIVAAANKTLEGTSAANGVEGVNFTHIIVQ
jgi:flagellar FliL protein